MIYTHHGSACVVRESQITTVFLMNIHYSDTTFIIIKHSTHKS